jgi:hypothetical protein
MVCGDRWGANKQWYQFDFLLSGGTGGKSNMTIILIQDTSVKERWDSGDDIKSGRWYTFWPPSPWVTRSETREAASFRAVFDKFGTDPSCWAPTASL